MKNAFVACEYNPFHNGHKYHLDEIKASGFDNIICIMSGNFVQRGEAALFEKHKRAELALKNGADLVIELPLKYAVSTASLFADGFVKTAKSTGIEGSISFGAENDINTLLRIKDIIFSTGAEEYCCEKIREGINYPNAKQEYLTKTMGTEYADILSDGNNTLGLEYIRARDLYFPSAGLFAVKRNSIAHDSDETDSIYASASYLRKLVYGTAEKEQMTDIISGFVPENCVSEIEMLFEKGLFPRDLTKFEAAAMSRLVLMTAEDFLTINNVKEGLENRITDAVRVSSSTSEVLYNVKTKRFTYSRLRQILINAVLGITKVDIENGISYIRVLGFNDKGRQLLNEMRGKSLIPVICNLSEINKNDSFMQRDALLDYNAGKLFSLTHPTYVSGNHEYNIPPVYVK